MRAAIFGGSGFIGMELAKEMRDRGDEVVIVSRSKNGLQDGITYITWSSLLDDPKPLEGFDAFVNIAGETINQRWTAKAKARIVNSRLQAARDVAAIIHQLQHKPQVVVNGSGMSIYGYSDEDTFDEDSPDRLTDFLAETVAAWEKEAELISGVRLVKLRIGLVLGTSGGAFPLMQLPYRLFVGGNIGSGKQWHSWIHIRDMTGIILHAIEQPEISGPINCTAPNPVTNGEFGRQLAKILRRPHWFPVPSLLLKVALGEMSEVLLKGQRVLPKRIMNAGYVFKFPALPDALRNL